MAQLSRADFYAKWKPLLADNEFQNIDGPRFDELLQDLRDSFASATLGSAPNVPTYDAATVYPAGFVVRYSQAGGRESFYYSLQAGLLPHPTYNQTDACWKLVPGPVAELALYQYLTLDEASGMDGSGVLPGRRYGVVGKWNSSPDDQLVFLDGLENYFRRRGTLLLGDGSQLEVEASGLAGTSQAATGGGGGRATLVLTTDQARRVSPALPILEPVTELQQVLRDNAAQALYQLDKDVYTAMPSYGQPDRTRAQVLALLQALTPAERAAGVELSVKVVPTASSQASTVYLRLPGVGGFVAATRAGFPTANEVPAAFYAAGDSWEENEPGKWIYGSNWLTYPDASYSGGNCAYLNAGTAGQAVLDKPVIGAALNFQLGGGAVRSTTVEARVWSSTGTGSWAAIGVANQVGQNLLALPNPNNYYQIRVTNTPGASGALTLLDLTQVQ